jgi:hypothetical protein
MDALPRRLFFLAEQTKAQTQLNGIDTGIRGCKSGVGNVHVADFGADVVLAAEEMQTEGGAGGEIDVGSPFRDFRIGKERAAADFEIRNDAPVRVQRPFEGKRVYTSAVSGVRFLNDQENRNGIHRIFQAAAKKTRPVRSGEDQAVTKPDIPDTVSRLAAIEAVATAGPNLLFMAALDGAGLRAHCWCKEGNHKDEGY